MPSKTYRSTFTKAGVPVANRIGINPFSISEIYNALVTMSWGRFFLVILLGNLFLTTLFTIAYSITGFAHFSGLQSTEMAEKFWEVFLYNAQTLSTVGGAGIAPVGFQYNLILTVESMMAMLGVAIITGLLYARFSRPSADIVCSDRALISPYKDGKGLMIRIANAKKQELVELHVSLFVVKNDLASTKRTVTVLDLERSFMPFLAHPLTIVHPLTPQSPLHNFDWLDTDNVQYDISFWFNGIDRATGQNVFFGRTYLLHEVVQNAKFLPCQDVDDQGVFNIYLGKIGDYEKMDH